MSYRNLFLVFAAAKVCLHLATATEYGYFRDELYYLACSEHLDLGYVDHPSLSILVLRASRALLGDSLPALRVVPALVFGKDLGLPRASSGHNNYWFWGPTGGNVWIVIGGAEAGLRARFDQVTLALDALDCGYCMPYESRRSVWIARGVKTSLADFWQNARHFD